jgi:hypothetical protein
MVPTHKNFQNHGSSHLHQTHFDPRLVCCAPRQWRELCSPSVTDVTHYEQFSNLSDADDGDELDSGL